MEKLRKPMGDRWCTKVGYYTNGHCTKGPFSGEDGPPGRGVKKYPCQERNGKFLGADGASEKVLGGVLGKVEYCTRVYTRGQN
jgi:hypothetical protein